MLRTVLNGKVHRATVTGANLDYIGSITRPLMPRQMARSRWRRVACHTS
ncbi:MAG TPA: aspartate 1-decarboxylase [Ktedonobacterales bacterium]